MLCYALVMTIKRIREPSVNTYLLFFVFLIVVRIWIRFLILTLD